MQYSRAMEKGSGVILQFCERSNIFCPQRLTTCSVVPKKHSIDDVDSKQQPCLAPSATYANREGCLMVKNNK